MKPTASPNMGRPASSLLRALAADRHFLLAAVILAVSAAGWGAAIQWLRVHTTKERVPWPAPVRVSDEYRLLSLAKEFGPFRKVEPNDEIEKGVRAPSDANFIHKFFSSAELEALGIGTPVDAAYLADRRSNWCVSLLYRDTRPAAVVRVWRLDVYYYTGGGETVPHVPEICSEAGGAKSLGAQGIRLPVPTVPPPWGDQVPLRRARYEMPGGRKAVDYYTFSMNGAFGESREWVRWELLNPFIRYAYYAKIQFSPTLMAVPDFEQTDLAAEEFLRHALPEVLKALASSRDMQAMERPT